MKRLPDERQIYITSRLWHELAPKVDLTPFIFAIHDLIDLAKYGDGLRKFYFTFVIVRPSDIVNNAYAHYNKRKREADIAVKIPYETAVRVSEKELRKLMEQAYLQGIVQLAALPLQGSFDVAGFEKDVKAIFAEEEGYERVMAERQEG